ncbi:MAG: aromatic amino acid DMT transporter YddG [Planctomycetota bacterium]
MTDSSPRLQATLFGFAAVLFWSSMFAVSRDVMTTIGPLTAGSLIYLSSGLFGVGLLLLNSGGIKKACSLPKPYLLKGGGAFVLMLICLYLAIGFVEEKQTVVEIGLLNYIWPGIVLAMSVPILKKKARWTLAPGILIAFVGAFVALTKEGEFSWVRFGDNALANFWPYFFTMVNVLAWGFYSNYSKKYAGETDGNAVPFFFLIAGLALGSLALFACETTRWSLRVGLEFAYLAIFPNFLAYFFWDQAMRRGNMTLVVLFAYFTPLLSTLFSCFFLGVLFNQRFLTACALVILGAVVSGWSIKEKKTNA